MPLVPKNLFAVAESPNDILVRWDPPDGNENIETYQLFYNDSFYRQNVRFVIKPATTEYRLKDLTPNTVYHIQVAASSSRGEGVRTPTIQVTTKPFREYPVCIDVDVSLPIQSFVAHCDRTGALSFDVFHVVRTVKWSKRNFNVSQYSSIQFLQILVSIKQEFVMKTITYLLQDILLVLLTVYVCLSNMFYP